MNHNEVDFLPKKNKTESSHIGRTESITNMDNNMQNNN